MRSGVQTALAVGSAAQLAAANFILFIRRSSNRCGSQSVGEAVRCPHSLQHDHSLMKNSKQSKTYSGSCYALPYQQEWLLGNGEPITFFTIENASIWQIGILWLWHASLTLTSRGLSSQRDILATSDHPLPYLQLSQSGRGRRLAVVPFPSLDLLCGTVCRLNFG